jgi:hypothetical protein
MAEESTDKMEEQIELCPKCKASKDRAIENQTGAYSICRDCLMLAYPDKPE